MTYAKQFFSSGFCLVLCACSPQEPTQPTKRYDLGAITVQLPATWQPMTDAAEVLVSAHQADKYLFLNAHSADSLLRENVVITISPPQPQGSFAHLDTLLVHSLGEELDHVRVLRSRDSVMTNREIAVAEFTCRLREPQLPLIGTMGFDRRGNRLTTIIGTALSHPRATIRKIAPCFGR